jgi:hypothetical protein
MILAVRPLGGWMTSQGTAHGRFTRALQQRNLHGAEIAAKEMGGLSLIDALDYLVVLAELQPERARLASIRWHGRLELESVALTLTESQLALSALASLCAGDTASVDVLRRLLRKVRPTLLRRMG